MDSNTFKALLSIDSYHRGYDQWLDLPNDNGVGTQIGNATISDFTSTLTASDERQVDFFASAYTLNGETIISYRGTDNKAQDTSM